MSQCQQISKASLTQVANNSHEFEYRFERLWFEKLIIHVKNAIDECLRIFSTHDDNMFDFFIKRFLIINCTLSFNDNRHRLEALIDTDATDYAFIDREIAQLVCNMLNMKSVSLLKSKSLIEFDDRHVSSIIHVIYFKLTIELHFELTALLLIIDLSNHSIILKKSWMNKHEIILNMTYDKLIFKSFKCNHHNNIFNKAIQIRRLKAFDFDRRWNVFNWRRDIILSKEDNAEHIATMNFRYTILSRLKTNFSTFYVQDESKSSDFDFSIDSKVDCDDELFVIEQNHFTMNIVAITKAISCKKRKLKKQRNKRWKIKKQQFEFALFFELNSNDSMNITMNNATSFCLFVDFKNRKQKMQCFFITINQIDFALKILRTNFESLKIVVMIKEILKHEQVKSIFERIMKKVSKYFRHLSKIFNSQKTIKLFSHKFYDHKIEFLNNSNALFRNRMYFLFELKFMKLKKYLKKNLQKNFIVFNQIAYISSILFVVKFNDQLRLCVNYRRLNHITKRNRYFIFLIEKTLIKMQDCKYLIKLNIISIFNKLRMSEKNEKFITFVTFMKSYKYRMLFLKLINDFASWQHSMNDFLFNFLNDFCQIYLNDIFIYNKFKKKHIVHVRAVLKKLKKIDL